MMRSAVVYLVLALSAVLLVVTKPLEAASVDTTYRHLAEDRSRDINSLTPNQREMLKSYILDMMADPKDKRGVSRRHASVSSLCKGRPIYECNDGLMSVWLRLLKNPDYADE